MNENNATQKPCCKEIKFKQENSNQNNDQCRCVGLESQLESCQKEVNDWREKALRSHADFENFKRRSEKERMQWMHTAQKDLLHSLLPIVDDAERGLLELQKRERTPEMDPWLSGYAMMVQSLHKFLKQFRVTEITQNESFNPELHEAIVTVQAEGKQPGDIVAVLQKGYLFNDEVLRPAKVSVAK